MREHKRRPGKGTQNKQSYGESRLGAFVLLVQHWNNGIYPASEMTRYSKFTAEKNKHLSAQTQSARCTQHCWNPPRPCQVKFKWRVGFSTAIRIPEVAPVDVNRRDINPRASLLNPACNPWSTPCRDGQRTPVYPWPRSSVLPATKQGMQLWVYTSLHLSCVHKREMYV